MLDVFGEFLLYILFELVWQGLVQGTGYVFVKVCTFGRVEPSEPTCLFFGVLVWVSAIVGLGVWLWR